MQLTHASNAAYVAWKQVELARAEEILSNEISRKSRPLLYHLANRALVRTRLRKWDGALDDVKAVPPIFIPALTLANVECHQVTSCQVIARRPPCKEHCTVWSETLRRCNRDVQLGT